MAQVWKGLPFFEDPLKGSFLNKITGGKSQDLRFVQMLVFIFSTAVRNYVK